MRDGKAVAVPVTPGPKVGDLTAITGAVKSGEKVVREAARDARRRRAREGRGQVAAAPMHAAMSARSEAAPAARAAAEPLVAIRGLTKYYVRGDQVIPVLVDINLDVRGGRLRRADGPVGLGQDARCST